MGEEGEEGGRYTTEVVVNIDSSQLCMHVTLVISIQITNIALYARNDEHACYWSQRLKECYNKVIMQRDAMASAGDLRQWQW